MNRRRLFYLVPPKTATGIVKQRKMLNNTCCKLSHKNNGGKLKILKKTNSLIQIIRRVDVKLTISNTKSLALDII